MELQIRFMRLQGEYLPINYPYLLSSWIYKVISQADLAYSTFLHEKGFDNGLKKFKLFTFSQLDLRPYEILGNRIRLLGKEFSLTLRFFVDSSLEHFIQGLFVAQEFSFGNHQDRVEGQVSSVKAVTPPDFQETMRYRCLSPIIASTKRDNGTVAYLSPQDPGFSRAFIQNLIHKYKALPGNATTDTTVMETFPFSFKLLNTPRQKGTVIKEGTPEETKVIGYLFHFELTAPVELQRIGYYAGFGEKNSLGMGCAGNVTLREMPIQQGVQQVSAE